MKMKQALAALAATSLVATPVVAQAAAASATRTAAPVGEAENLQGGWLVPALAIIAILLGILAITSGGDDDDLPTSP
jgi:hypothetical protein